MHKRELQTAVLLAAGRGKRLRPHTDHTPKPLLPVNGRPTLDFALTALKKAGFRRTILVTHHLEEQIHAYVGDGAPWDLQIKFAHQLEMLGTANALQAAIAAAPEWFIDPFLLSATDYIFPENFFADLVRRWWLTRAKIVVSMKDVPAGELGQRSSVRFHGDFDIVEVVEKPEPWQAPSPYAANLTYILPPEIAPELGKLIPSPRGEYELQTAVNALISAGFSARGLLQPVPAEWKAESA